MYEWKTRIVAPRELEDALNALDGEGYEVYTIEALAESGVLVVARREPKARFNAMGDTIMPERTG